jgi:hypothetical protein
MFRQDLRCTALGKHTVTNLTATREKAHAGFTNTEWREVVMQHKLLEFHALDIVHALLVNLGAECCSNQGLGLTTGKQCATVGARQNTYFAGDRANCAHVATVDTDAVFSNHLTDNALLDRAKDSFDLFFTTFELFSKGFLDCGTIVAQSSRTLLLGLNLGSDLDVGFRQLSDFGFQNSISLGNDEFAFLEANQFGQLSLCIDQRL